LGQFAQVTSNIIEAAVSVKRLDNFLSAAELQTDAVEYVPTSSLQEGEAVSFAVHPSKSVNCLLIDFVQVLSIKGGEFSWDRDNVQSTLEDINLKVNKGQLVGVLGRVGAGKVLLTFHDVMHFLNLCCRPAYCLQ
jgi:ABC-type multidrug transport system fused ATPase/permease subunit